MKYTNPRTKAIIDDWPIGGSARGTAIFTIEVHPTRGERCSRETEKKNGTWGKPKRGTYSDRVRIMDGEDGRTYVVSHSSGYGMISVMRGDMKYSEESFFRRDDVFEEILASMEAS